MKMKLSDGLCVLLSLGAGLLLGWVDSHMEPVGVTIALVALGGGALGLARPNGAWRWALVLGLGVFLWHLLEAAVGYRPPYPAEPSIFITLIAIVPALVGAYGGVLLRRLLAHN
jgi:hypothetical protein